MKRRAVVTGPDADDDIRLAAPNLFFEELAQALDILALEPGVGQRWSQPDVPGLRRLVLRATRHHVYFTFTDDMVVVLAVWGSSRGSAPRLGRRLAALSKPDLGPTKKR